MENQKRSWFERFARATEQAVGSKWAFLSAIASVIVWASFGPTTHYSDTWELIINTATTIVTFIMVFILQHTQTHDSEALHAKIDELIRATAGARNKLIGAREMDTEALSEITKELLEEAHTEEDNSDQDL